MSDVRLLEPADLSDPTLADPFREQPGREPAALAPPALFEKLDALGIAHSTLLHPPVFTVEEARAVRGKLPGGHVKNLCLRDKKKKSYLVVMDADTPVDLKALAKVIGAGNLSFASPDRLWELLGVTPGSVTPFSLVNDPENRVNLILDEALLNQEPLNIHPLLNRMTTAISVADLHRWFESTGHTPTVLDLANIGQ